jgi:hypothetical protein
MKPVTGTNRDGANKAIQLPDKLTSPDGREFRLQEWNPQVSCNGVVTVTAKMIVYLPDKKDSEQ